MILAAIAAGVLAGCGDKAEPPLTTEKLDPAQKTTEDVPQTGGTQFQRPEPNPNAKYAPRR